MKKYGIQIVQIVCFLPVTLCLLPSLAELGQAAFVPII